MAHRAYRSLPEAEALARKRFRDGWGQVCRLADAYRAFASQAKGLNALGAGLRDAEKAVPALRKAARNLKAALAKWEPHFPLEALGLPDSFLSVLKYASDIGEAVEDAAAFVQEAKAEAKRNGVWETAGKLWIVRRAAKHGIKADGAADWCIAFIALGPDFAAPITEPNPGDAAREWSQRIAKFTTDARDAGLLPLLGGPRSRGART